MKFGLMLLRAALVAALGLALLVPASTGAANAAGVENLMVPSAAMGRDIPVTFMAGGPHAVYLLDAFDAGDPVSNWVTAGNAMNTLPARVSRWRPQRAAPTASTPTGSRTAVANGTHSCRPSLPNWLAANKGLAPGGHAVVGAAQGGTGALMLAESHPDRFRYAGSMSGFLYPSNTTVNGAITDGMMRFGGVDTQHVGRRPTWPVEVARPLRAHRRLGEQQHPGVDLQPANAHGQ